MPTTVSKRRKLTKLVLDRVDLVNAGSNPGAHIELFKSATAEVEKATFNEIQDARMLSDMLSEVCKYTWDLQDAIYSSLYSDGDKAAEVMTSIDQFSAAVDKALANWTKGKPVYRNKEEEEAHTGVFEKLSKMKERLDTIRKEASVSAAATATTTVTEESVQKAIKDALEKQEADHNTALQAALAKQKKEADDEIEKVRKETAEKVKTAEDAVAVEKHKRETAEYVQKAKTNYSHIPGKAEDLGGALLALDKAIEVKAITKEQVEVITKALDAAEGAFKLTLNKEDGADNSETEVGAMAEVTAKATELMKADPKLSKEQARVKVYNDHPDLFRKVRAEQGGRRIVEDDGQD